MKRPITRRRVLRGMLGGAAVSVALPLLDCFLNTNGTAYADGAPLPVTPRNKIRFAERQRQVAPLLPSHPTPQLCFESFPDTQGADHQREFSKVPVLLTDKAEIATRLG